MIRVGRRQLWVWSNTSHSGPRTSSSPRRSRRSRRSPSNLSSRTGNHRIGSRRIRSPTERLSRQAEVVAHFPCRKRRMSTSSRPRFPPRRERFGDSERCFAVRHPPPPHSLMRTLRSPVTMTTRQPPTPVPLCFADFASKPAWYAPFQVLLYFR